VTRLKLGKSSHFLATQRKKILLSTSWDKLIKNKTMKMGTKMMARTMKMLSPKMTSMLHGKYWTSHARYMRNNRRWMKKLALNLRTRTLFLVTFLWRQVDSRCLCSKTRSHEFAEKFDQAIKDYAAGLKLKTGLLPLSSRHIAEAHYKLSIVLDLTSGRLADSIIHAQKALESVEARLSELKAGQDTAQPTSIPEEPKADSKGKGKAKGTLARDDEVASMSKSQIEAEIKELSELKEDLALKVCTVFGFFRRRVLTTW
jgi:hypothetical protein